MSDDEITVTKDGKRLVFEMPDTMPAAHREAERLATDVLRRMQAAVEQRLDELVHVGYRGPVFAWYDFDVGRIDVHVDTKQPDSGSNARSFYQRYDVTDESAAIWLAHKARR